LGSAIKTIEETYQPAISFLEVEINPFIKECQETSKLPTLMLEKIANPLKKIP
jgi:hypothetical protein